ncbi:putative cytochrome b5 [Limtongia smithiae]|uniref:putative cytochrome b5 n=1 Tax=Limtongia smithiae TaxID=1125753 RepID=UPI0034CE2D80
MASEEPAPVTYYTYEALKEYNQNDNLWMAIHGKVYNCTKFLDEHPGGEEVLLDAGGIDATEAFEDVGHSDEARKLLDEMLVGEIDPSEVKVSSKAPPSGGSSSSSSSSGSALKNVFIVAVVAIFAFLFTQMSKANSKLQEVE